MAMGISMGIGIPSGVLSSGSGLDGTSFITTWKTTTANETITIPTLGINYNYTVTTSDGQTFTNVTGNQSITFATAGDYDVSISGAFPYIRFNNGGDKLKIIDIKQWGNIVWSTFLHSFRGCSNLVGSYTDAPNLSSVSTMNNAFRDCNIFTGEVSDWDVSNVTTMGSMFRSSELFNSDCSSWDVSSVTQMNGMFQEARTFNQDVGSWDVSKVTNMSSMFSTTNLFDQNLESWNISKVATFGSFKTAGVFSTANYDALLIGWNNTLLAAFPGGAGYNLTPSISFGNSQYTAGGAAEAARTSLEAVFNWTITDGGSV
jgi:surface protein